MGIIKEVAEGLRDVADGIEHIRTVAKAVRDGQQYLKLKHPDIQANLAAMCAEMRNTSMAVAAASAVLTHFRFTIAGSALDAEPARFNDHLIAHKEKAQGVYKSLQAMRGHCHVIKEHADHLRKKAKSLNLDRLLLLFGIDSSERDERVEAALQDIYDEEMQAYRLVAQLASALQLALSEIGKALGPSGGALPANVPIAAAVLGEYADAFSKLETTGNYLALDLQESIGALQEQV